GSMMPSPSVAPSQTLPMPSPSSSRWSAFATFGQLSQASPTPSPSVSFWLPAGRSFSFGPFFTARQLSQALPTPSWSSSSAWSGLLTVGPVSCASGTASVSSAGWQASPWGSLSEFFWSAFFMFGQLSQTSPTPSPSASFWLALLTSGQLSSQFVLAPPVQRWSPIVPLPSPSSRTPSLSVSPSPPS